ncbi:response regulator transcription factor [Marinobacter subterrani]|uniref:Two component transcriptional regulator, LuxR family n=1 Tax=Marinobacter subterrani TaxID=1658765 RepID=A0A0J7JF62_9GAMM|nr:response regulator transcription factor [Marinobacter subterrani]KMQ76549.1 two component transcriptional regulator, LuxR family [Marinobacter subterrani]
MGAIISEPQRPQVGSVRTLPLAKVLLVDDHALFAQGLAGLMHQEGLAESVTTVATVESAADLLAHDDGFELVLLDIALHGETGLALLPRLASHRETPPVVIISSSEDESTVRAARAAGASGFLAKSAGRSALVTMVRAVIRGEGYFPGGVRPLTQQLPLTPRQMDVLVLLAQGFPNKRICQSLDLTEHTVKTHLKAIFSQLGVHNRTECVNLARVQGWL